MHRQQNVKKKVMFCLIFWKRYEDRRKNMMVTRQQFVITHTLCQAEFTTVLERRVTNTSAVMVLCPHTHTHTHTHTQNCSSSYFCRNIKCLSFGLLWICQAFSLSFTTVYQGVMANCCFMSNKQNTEGQVKRRAILRDCTYKFLTFTDKISGCHEFSK